ncbi:MAG TPA: hypothetical protein VNA25_02750 [Phycisphaerae bacterium]|nr:hypothetical protein [Phycisphaerae bacterium]HUT56776.1 hypothetical protein [Phycisphaerae bacterium]
MRTVYTTALALLVMGAACARVEGADGKEGEARGKFVKLTEKQIGRQEYVGIVVKQERGEPSTFFVSRRSADLLAAAKALKPGQLVEIAYVAEDDHSFVRRINAKRAGEGRGEVERPRDDIRALQAELRELRAQIKRLAGEVAELREQNVRLRRDLGEGAREGRKREGEGKEGEGDKPREVRREREEGREPKEGRKREGEGERADAGKLPDGLRGFRGVMVGTVVRKAERALVLNVEKITRTWKESKAENPKAAVGKRVHVVVSPKYDKDGRHTRALAKLKIGDRVVVEAFHFEGEALVVVEQLQKAER